jgi:hypothetical protein
MTRSVQGTLGPLEVQSVSAKPKMAKVSLQKVSCPAPTHLISLALSRAGLSQKEAALTMGISESLLARQLKGDEHLSWQRLCSLPDAFFYELLIVLAEWRGIARVQTQIQMERRVG